MDGQETFLSVLRCAAHGETWDSTLSREEARPVVRLAREHSALPLIVEAAGEALLAVHPHAKALTIAQAQRTADFLLLYDFLSERGLRPAVMKGITLRALYPQPEQRASTDEDLLVRPEDFPAYHQAMLDYGLALVNPDENLETSDEVSYEDKTRGLYIEVHKSGFSASSAYGDLNALFEGCLDRCTEIEVYGQKITTLSPTDHLLYLLCHAYKHFLHGGVGIRQVCDIGIFSEHYADEIDWNRVRTSCDSVRIAAYSAALFRIAEKHLGFPMPAAFADLDLDEADMLEDILSGGLYGVNDINRAHSSTITLDAVASQKQGKQRRGVLASVFLPLGSMRGRYPYLRRFPWLLPVAWTQRVLRYLTHRDGLAPGKPGETVRIGKERVELLREYGILD